jgi:transketolase
MPGLVVVRPADANETAQAWRFAVDRDGPTALALSRQDLPVLDGVDPEGVAKGAYVLRSEQDPALVLVGTGGEVAVCVEAADRLTADGVPTTVVSMPSWELFRAQDPSYRSQVLPAAVPRLSVEAGATFGWCEWVDASVGIDRFGASAPGTEALRNLGINTDNVVDRARALIGDSP